MAFGWPLFALRWSHTLEASQPPRLNDGLQLLRPVAGPRHAAFHYFRDVRRALPLRPIWPGFAINTLFYAAILWLLFAVPFALRRHVRIKRGLCPACAYPIGDSPVCTECGKPVRLK